MKQTILLVLLLAVAGASAQQKTLALNPVTFIKGVVVDSKDNTPVGFANVMLKNRKDSSLVKGVSSGVTGEFLLGNIAPGEYYLVVSYIGYGKKMISDIRVTSNPKEVNLGIIKLEQTAVQMNGVQVVGERPAEEFRPDKKVINVAQNLDAAGGTAVDVLQKQPSVSVDADGTVSLRGSTNFTVLVNGRPSPLQGTDALRQIAASSIETIEIITNPSAKYDAEGAAGIVNINLKSTSDYTSSGLMNLGVGTRNKCNGDASGSVSANGLTVNGGVDYRNMTNYFPFSIDRTSPGSTGVLANTTDMDRKTVRENLTLRGGVEYKLTSQQTVAISGSFGRFGFLGDWFSRVTNMNGTRVDYTYVANRMDVPAKLYNGQFSYSNKITPQVDDLSFEATYSNVKIPNGQTTDEYQSNESFTERGANPLMQMLNNNAHRTEGRFKLNGSHKFAPKSTLELGLQSNLSLREFDVLFANYSWTSSGWVTNPDLTNSFSLRSNVHSAFVTYSNSVLEFDFQAGLRAEQMDRFIDLPTFQKTYSLKKLDLFPSFNMSRKIDDHTFQFTYSRRVNRPNDALLNPSPFYSDSYLRQTGNPELLPEYIHSLEVNYQKPISGVYMTVQTFARFSKGGLMQTQSVEPDGRLLLTFENLAHSSTLGAEVSASFSLGSMWKFDPSVNVSSFRQEGRTATEQFETRSFGVTSRLNATATVTPSTRVQLTANYFGRQMFGQMTMEPRFLLGASVRQEFLDKKLSVTVNAQNLLDTAVMKFNQEMGGLRSYATMRPELQMVNLTMSYNFNNFKRVATQNVDIGADVGR